MFLNPLMRVMVCEFLIRLNQLFDSRSLGRGSECFTCEGDTSFRHIHIHVGCSILADFGPDIVLAV
jgi:hypothetical protein